MISFIRGKLVGKSASVAFVDVGGVGFGVNMSQIALSNLPEAGKEVFLQTYFHVREDSMQLFGFLSAEEKQLFTELIGVSGVGPKVALAALSFFEPSTLAAAIVSENIKEVSKIPGVGKKMASRIVLELKGSLEAQGYGLGANGASSDTGVVGTGASNESAHGITGTNTNTNNKQPPAINATKDALLGMGFTQQEIELALNGANAKATEAELLQYALKRLGSA